MNISKGLDIPIRGLPASHIDPGARVGHVALLGPDYHGLRPTMKVDVGDQVRVGDVLFEDKKNTGVVFTSPASGKVKAVNRGEKRIFLSLVVEIDSSRDSEDRRRVLFDPLTPEQLSGCSKELARDRLVRSGLWTALRTRPFSKTPAADSDPQGLFVSTLDTRPLAINPDVVISRHKEAFSMGLLALHRATGCRVYLNTGLNQNIPGADSDFISCEVWEGKHPAGLVGTHMHHLLPVNLSHVNWHIGYQDVIAAGYLFLNGQLWVTRYVAVAGSEARQPRVLETRLGAHLSELIRHGGEIIDRAKNTQISSGEAPEVRVISGSVLGGRTAQGELDYISRWSNQVSLIPEGTQRDFFLTKGWLSPGFHKFSVLGTYLGKFVPGFRFAMTTSTQGSRRAMVPIGLYEKVMPLDIIPTYLLRSLIAGDTERAQELGALELDEEDLALCTYVCPGKYEYGPVLRDNLDDIEKNG